MNQDADERLVPQDQYISATNVEIATSEGSNLGTVQNLLGNSKFSTIDDGGYYGVPDTATCVGSIAALDKDKIYYFVAGGDKNSSSQTGKTVLGDVYTNISNQSPQLTYINKINSVLITL